MVTGLPLPPSYPRSAVLCSEPFDTTTYHLARTLALFGSDRAAAIVKRWRLSTSAHGVSTWVRAGRKRPKVSSLAVATWYNAHMSNDCVSAVGQDYYATAYVRVRAATEADAVTMIEAAFTMEEEHESVDGVFLTVCGGPWEGVEPAEEDPCTCPPEFIARNDGSFRGGCPVHAS